MSALLQPLSLCASYAARSACLAAALLGLHGAATAQAAPALLGEGPQAVTAADILAETQPLNAANRASVLSSPASVQRMATDIYLRRSLSARASDQKIDEKPEVQRVLQIVRERVLADALARQVETQARAAQPESVLEQLARQNYKAMPQRFQQPERLHLRHILIPADATDAHAQAEALHKQLQQGASFEALAREHSKDPGSAAKGGDLGFVTRGKMVAPFEEAAFALEQPGELSGVVETQFGFHVIELVEKRPAGLQPFDEVKDRLVEEAAGGVGVAARQELARPILESATPHVEAIEAFSASYRN